METLLILFAAAAGGVAFDWAPLPDDPAGPPGARSGVEYVVHLDDDALRAAQKGQLRTFESNVPEGVGPVRRVRVVLGEPQPHNVRRPVTDAEDAGPVKHTTYQQPSGVWGPQTPPAYPASANNALEQGFQQAAQQFSNAANDPQRKSIGTELQRGAEKLLDATGNVLRESTQAVEGTVLNVRDGVRGAVSSAVGNGAYQPFNYTQPTAAGPTPSQGVTPPGYAAQPGYPAYQQPQAGYGVQPAAGAQATGGERSLLTGAQQGTSPAGWATQPAGQPVSGSYAQQPTDQNAAGQFAQGQYTQGQYTQGQGAQGQGGFTAPQLVGAGGPTTDARDYGNQSYVPLVDPATQDSQLVSVRDTRQDGFSPAPRQPANPDPWGSFGDEPTGPSLPQTDAWQGNRPGSMNAPQAPTSFVSNPAPGPDPFATQPYAPPVTGAIDNRLPAQPTGYAAPGYPAGPATPADERPWGPLVFATLVSIGSLSGNLFLGFNYLDARNKYRAALRRTVRSFGRAAEA